MRNAHFLEATRKLMKDKESRVRGYFSRSRRPFRRTRLR